MASRCASWTVLMTWNLLRSAFPVLISLLPKNWDICHQFTCKTVHCMFRWRVAEPGAKMLLFCELMRVCEQAFLALSVVLLSFESGRRCAEICIQIVAVATSFRCPVFPHTVRNVSRPQPQITRIWCWTRRIVRCRRCGSQFRCGICLCCRYCRSRARLTRTSTFIKLLRLHNRKRIYTVTSVTSLTTSTSAALGKKQCRYFRTLTKTLLSRASRSPFALRFAAPEWYWRSVLVPFATPATCRTHSSIL